MANWHYFNKNGEKVGPISVEALKALVGQGLITRETLIENHTGRTILAGEVNGLAFPPTATPQPVIPLAPPTSDDVYGLASPQPVEIPPTHASASIRGCTVVGKRSVHRSANDGK